MPSLSQCYCLWSLGLLKDDTKITIKKFWWKMSRTTWKKRLDDIFYSSSDWRYFVCIFLFHSSHFHIRSKIMSLVWSSLEIFKDFFNCLESDVDKILHRSKIYYKDIKGIHIVLWINMFSVEGKIFLMAPKMCSNFYWNIVYKI